MRGENILYIGYLIILDGQSIKKISFGKLYCLQQVNLAENLPQATHTQHRGKRHKYGLIHALHSLDGHVR